VGLHTACQTTIAGRVDRNVGPALRRNTLAAGREEDLCWRTCPCCAVVADMAAGIDVEIRETRMEDVDIPAAAADVEIAGDAWLDARLLLSRGWSTFGHPLAKRDPGVRGSSWTPRTIRRAGHESGRSRAGLEGRRLLARVRGYSWKREHRQYLRKDRLRKTCLLETFFFEMASKPTHSTFAWGVCVSILVGKG
jgi:hypothetical protein